MDNSRIPLSHVIKELHEKLQTELKMYKYQGKANSIVHQVAENEEAVEKVLSKPKRKKKSLEEKLAAQITPQGAGDYTINFSDNELNKIYDLKSVPFANVLKGLLNNQIKSNPRLSELLADIRNAVDAKIDELAEYLVASVVNAKKKNPKWEFNATLLNKINPEISINAGEVSFNKEQIDKFFTQ